MNGTMNGLGWLIVVLQVLGTAVLPPLALWFVVLTITGRRSPTRPHCGGCGTLLAFPSLAEGVPCPGCGRGVAELAAEGKPPRPERRRRWILWPALALALLAGTAGSIALALTLFEQTRSQSVVAARTTLDALIASGIKATHEMDGSLLELGRRLRIGDTTPAELRAALIAHLDASAAAPPAPSVGFRSVVGMAMEAAADPSFCARALSSAWTAPTVPANDLASRLRGPRPTIGITIDPWERSDAPVARWVILRSVEIDGTPVAFGPAGGSPQPATILAIGDGASRPAELRTDRLAAGKHRVKLVFEDRLVRGAVARAAWASNATSAAADWDHSLARRDVVVDTEVDIQP